MTCSFEQTLAAVLSGTVPRVGFCGCLLAQLHSGTPPQLRAIEQTNTDRGSWPAIAALVGGLGATLVVLGSRLFRREESR